MAKLSARVSRCRPPRIRRPDEVGVSAGQRCHSLQIRIVGVSLQSIGKGGFQPEQLSGTLDSQQNVQERAARRGILFELMEIRTDPIETSAPSRPFETERSYSCRILLRRLRVCVRLRCRIDLPCCVLARRCSRRFWLANLCRPSLMPRERHHCRYSASLLSPKLFRWAFRLPRSRAVSTAARSATTRLDRRRLMRHDILRHDHPKRRGSMSSTARRGEVRRLYAEETSSTGSTHPLSCAR